MRDLYLCQMMSLRVKNAKRNHLISIQDLVARNYPNSRITVNSTNSNNKFLELNANESITHNDFTVPDWGNLRFDLYSPNAQGWNSCRRDKRKMVLINGNH